MTNETTISTGFDVDAIRQQFPILRQPVHGDRPLIYLDSAATSQKPQVVIDSLVDYYTTKNANVHRSAHYLSAAATNVYEDARKTVAEFIGAESPECIVFTKGTTEAINLVANTWGQANIGKGDAIIVTGMEHHANIVPWQMLCERVGAELRLLPVENDGTLALSFWDPLVEDGKVKLLAITHVSNTLGTINPVAALAARARKRGIVTVVDGAQAVAHVDVNMDLLGCDFYAFGAHKVYGPTGIGVLYGRRELLESMPPWQGGGAMISSVTWEKTTYNDVPIRFEAGTPHIEGAAGFAAALRWFVDLDHKALRRHEQEILRHMVDVISQIDGVRFIGTAPVRTAVVSFVVDGIHASDLGTLLDQHGIAVRTGHHCTMPLLERFGVPSTVRASVACHTTHEEVEAFGVALQHAVRMLR